MIPKILVIGDIILDRYVYGNSTRLSQEAPVPVVLVDKVTYILGGASNVAANLSDLGADVYLTGMVGNDHFAASLIELLDNKKIKCSLVFTSLPTIVKTRVISNDQHLVRFDIEKNYEKETENLLNKIKILSKENFDGVIISDYSKGSITEEIVYEIKNSFACKIFADIKPEHKEWYNNIYSITPNLNEAKRMSHKKELVEIAKDIKETMSLNNVVITLSEEGLLLVDDKNDVYKCYAHQRSVKERHHKKDVSGAGDTLLSVFCWSVISGNGLHYSVVLSNVAASVVVDKLGTSTCSYEELQQEIKEEINLPSKLIKI